MFDQALANGEIKDVKTVLIRRRDGSLKDALTQIIEQLGPSFKRYLAKVITAIDNISQETARQTLAQEISLELGPKWQDRKRDPFDKRLKSLGEACRTEGFMKWLCRDGGVIDRRIRRLVDPSEMEERETSPKFTEQDLLVEARYKRSSELTDAVSDLILECADDKSLREEAAETLNAVLSDAIGGMVGLDGTNLRELFDSIRKDLKSGQKPKTLAIFVEDVSVMSELDVNIVTALEPTKDPELCPLTAAIGMTHKSYDGGAIREGQEDRITYRYKLDGETTDKWSQDGKGLSRFVARYFNAIRLEEQQVRDLAETRQSPGVDVAVSKCETCDARRLCHKTFGFVELGGTKIGMYPFSEETAIKSLELIGKKTPRRLLIEVVQHVMQDTASLQEERFPDASRFPVQVADPVYWAAMQNKYLGNYTHDDRERTKILAELWIKTPEDEDEAASRLKPFLGPLGLADFAQKAPEPPIKDLIKDPIKDPAPPANQQLKVYLDALSAWFRGEQLKKENDFRDWLSAVVTKSIPWDLLQQPAQFVVTTWDIVKGRYFINIEGQSSAPDKNLHYTFERNEETRALLEALMRRDKEGQGSWDFKNGQNHQRVVSRWVRKHADSIVVTLTPAVDVSAAVKSAVQFLALYATIRDRERFPKRSDGKIVDRLFDKAWDQTPRWLSPKYGKAIDALETRYVQTRNFLLRELAVRQGRGGINLIDPQSIATTIRDFHDSPIVSELPEEFLRAFWKSRFAGLSGKDFCDLKGALAEERKEIKRKVDSIADIFISLDYEVVDLKANYVGFCTEILEMTEKAKTAKIVYPNETFESYLKQNRYAGDERVDQGNYLKRALEVSASSDPSDVLVFDPSELCEIEKLVTVGYQRYEQIESHVIETEDDVTGGDDPRAAENDFFAALQTFAEFGRESEGERNVEVE